MKWCKILIKDVLFLVDRWRCYDCEAHTQSLPLEAFAYKHAQYRNIVCGSLLIVQLPAFKFFTTTVRYFIIIICKFNFQKCKHSVCEQHKYKSSAFCLPKHKIAKLEKIAFVSIRLVRRDFVYLCIYLYLCYVPTQHPHPSLQRHWPSIYPSPLPLLSIIAVSLTGRRPRLSGLRRSINAPATHALVEPGRYFTAINVRGTVGSGEVGHF